MEAGLLIPCDAPPEPSLGRGRAGVGCSWRLVELVVRSEELGFDAVWLGERLAAPSLRLAAGAERTRRIRLGAALNLLDTLDPLRAAEDAATLDVLSDGRVELVVGHGRPLTGAERAGGPEASQAILGERVELLLRVLAGEDVTWQGLHRGPLRGVTVHPRPVQRPHPPLWIAGDRSPASAELAAHLGLPLFLPGAADAPEAAAALVAHYRERFARAGHDATGMRVGACSPAHGSPAEVLERALGLRETLALDVHLALLDPGAVPGDALEDTLALFGAQVLPALRAA